ncbi:MAG: heat-inducible transcriptional repressor HrcA [Actinomycetota bacterium]|jgi:heat-inducible transcriptional repressor
MENRKLTILRAIVDEFVTSHEPVGSKAIAAKHALGVSPATIRNDMAVLEEQGYIAQPHTSAGRIPTDKGYRLFVDRLSEVKPLSGAERNAISQFLDQAVDLDDIMVRTTKLLAQLTQQVAIVQYPSLQLTKVLHVELVAMAHKRMMVIVIADSGRVEQRVIDVPIEVGEVTLDDIRTRLNNAVSGQFFAQVPEKVSSVVESFDATVRPLVSVIVSGLLESLVERAEERIVVSGAGNLARRPNEFAASVGPLLEALEENVVLLKLLGETDDSMHVRIGHENSLDSFNAASVISTGYGSDNSSVARMGIVGPTHMNYESSIAAVTAVARYVGRIVTEH